MRNTIFLLLAFATATACSAQLFRYTLSGNLYDTDVPNAFAVGDSFTLSFTLNMSATDGHPDPNRGIFNNAVSDMTFALGPGATGNYDGATVSASRYLDLSDDFSGMDWIYAYFTGGDFALADGHAVNEIRLGLQSNSDSIFDFVSAQGQTLASVLPGGIDPISYDDAAYIYVAMNNNALFSFGTVNSISASSIPEPSTYATITGVIALCGVVFIRRQKKQEGRKKVGCG